MAPAEMAVVPLLAAVLLSPVLSPPAAAMPLGAAGEPGSGEPTPPPTEGSGPPETAAIDAEDRDEPLLWVELPSAWSGPWKEEGAEAGSGLGETTQRPELVEHLGSEEGEQELQFHVVAKQTRKTRRRNQTVIEEQPEGTWLSESATPSEKDTILGLRVSVLLRTRKPRPQQTRTSSETDVPEHQTPKTKPATGRSSAVPGPSTGGTTASPSDGRARGTALTAAPSTATEYRAGPGPTTEPATAADTALETSLAGTETVTSSQAPPAALTPRPTPPPTAGGAAGLPGERETDGSRLRQEYCRTTFICVFHGWATVCVIVLMFLVLRTVVNNFGSAVQWCCHLRSRHRRSDVMRAVDAINIGMDRKSWAKKSPCSPQIKAEIESRLRQLFIRCDVTLEMVGSLSSRLGKSLNARPEAEDSLQEYRFTEPVLGADADFMVVLQVPMAPTTAGGRELPRYMLDGVPPYLTLSPFTGARAASGSSLARRWSPGTPPAEAAAGSEAGLELHSFTARPDTALSVCPLTSSPSLPAAERSGGRGVTKAGGGDAGGGDSTGDTPGGGVTKAVGGAVGGGDRTGDTADGGGDGAVGGGDGTVGGGDGRDTAARDGSADGGDGAGDRTAGAGAKAVATGRFRCTSLGTDCAGAAAAVGGLPPGQLGPPGENGVSDGSGGLRTDPDGETATLRRSVSLTQMPVLLRFPTLEASRQESTPPGFAHVQLFLDRVLPEDRSWWRDAMSEPVGGALYLSSKKARQLMRDMFESLQLTVEQDRQSMSMVDRCLADYRGEPSYDKDVKSRGPAVTLRLTQTDDRAIANMPFFQNSCCHWLCICCSVILLLPFCVWIFLTGGSWPVRKCTGGACCSIYYTVTLLVPMVLVLPALLVVLALRRPEPDPVADAAAADQLHIGFVIAYVALSALCASLFVCVSQCFFKLPTIFYGDFVTALVCPEWPNDAMQFKTRSRQWPTRYEVDGIVRQGCHLVPKPPRPCRCLAVNGPAACDDAHLLWRYSFSKAEVRLSQALPEHYRRAYMTFKWLVKKYVTRSSCPMYGIGSNMRSYYLKTVLFWELDLRGAVEWSEGVEEELLQRLARRTLRHIRQRHLPHFFIPDINLLDELTQTDFEMVADLMEKILAGPAALLNMPQLTWQMSTIGMCEAIFCTPGRDFQSDVCCNYASRMHTVW
ncbi:uncharacterized protein LOC122377780 isoform X2 [Amphibalanus amphitrite]|uniref:uncharacterized protein LOC122377780 isoform X2 n=1 Tax=Amphibalanus amphitrite TaxID=1232801 RepID=UPI001C91D6F3|nr:uncharacterized protein LOC122377780 isoform X2 [Amphibalanus amphitrite]